MSLSKYDESSGDVVTVLYTMYVTFVPDSSVICILSPTAIFLLSEKNVPFL